MNQIFFKIVFYYWNKNFERKRLLQMKILVFSVSRHLSFFIRNWQPFGRFGLVFWPGQRRTDVRLDLCFDTCPENLISVPVVESQHVLWHHLHTEMLHSLGSDWQGGPRIPSPRNLKLTLYIMNFVILTSFQTSALSVNGDGLFGEYDFSSGDWKLGSRSSTLPQVQFGKLSGITSGKSSKSLATIR